MKKITKCIALIIMALCIFILSGCNIKKEEYQTYQSTFGNAIKNYNGAEDNLIVPTSYNDIDIKEIGSSCYAFNIYLKDVKIGDNIEAIRACAFFYCTNIVSIYIPKSVRLIEPYAFHKLTCLTHVYYEGTQEEFMEMFEDDEDNINSNADLFKAFIEYNYTLGD